MPNRAHSPWACPSCRYVESPQARYCSNCGEARLTSGTTAAARAPGWRRWLDTLGLLLRHPGQLTRDHLRGRRQQRITPGVLLLSTHALFALAVWWGAPALFKTPLAFNLQGQGLSGQGWPASWASAWVQAKLVASAVPVESYAVRFDVLQPLLAVASLPLLLPLWLLAAAAVHHGPRLRWSALWVAVQHLLTLLLLWAAGCVLVWGAYQALTQRFGVSSLSAMGLPGLWLAASVVAAALVYTSAGRVFGSNVPRQALCAAVLLAAGVGLLALHRVLVFAATALVV